jgi:hypothetical protein
MPQDGEGNFVATQQCITRYEYDASSTLITTKQSCYNEHDIYFNYGIEWAIILTTVSLCILVVSIFLKRKIPDTISIVTPPHK